IRRLMPNATRLIDTFKADLSAFLARPGSSMQVLFATADSAFYNEMTQTVLGPDLEKKAKAAYDGNHDRIAGSEGKLAEMAANGGGKLEIRHFNTQFRLPIILVDDDRC